MKVISSLMIALVLVFIVGCKSTENAGVAAGTLGEPCDGGCGEACVAGASEDCDEACQEAGTCTGSCDSMQGECTMEQK